MGTRATLQICTPRNPDIYLYRHWDGYPEMMGRDIAHAAATVSRCSERKAPSKLGAYFLGLLAAEACDQGVNPAHGIYATTNGHHGDTDFHYVVTFHHDLTATFEVFERFDLDADLEPIFSGSLVEYRRYIAEETRQILEAKRKFLARKRSQNR